MIFLGNSSNSGKIFTLLRKIIRIFTLLRKIIRIMADAQPGTSCRSLCKESGILPLPFQYILSLMNCIVSYKEIFQTYSSVHNINTSNKHHPYRPNANLSCFQKSTFCAGIKIFNILPPSLTVLKNNKAKF